MNCMRGPFNVDDSDIESSVSSNLSYPASTNSHTGSRSDENNNNDIKSDGNVGELEQMKLFAAVETARVNRWKLFVIITILVVGGAVSTFTFITLSNQQSTDAFNAVSLHLFSMYHFNCDIWLTLLKYSLNIQFDLFANTINDSFTFRVKVIFDSNRALSRSITSSSIEVSYLQNT
jgi:hypothetical protein